MELTFTEVVQHFCVLLVTREVGDFDYGVSKSETKPSFKIAEALSSTSHDQGDRVTRLIKTAMSRRFHVVSR